METQNSSRSGKLLSRLAVMLLVAALGACGGGGGEPFGGGGGGTPTPDDGGSGDGDSDTDPGSDDTEPGGVATAVIMDGAVAYDPGVRVLNAAFSVLDANGDVIEGLDGGDFEIVHEETKSEGHHDAQRLPYPTQLSGRIHLMLDISNSMGGYDFDEYTTQAKQFVEEMVAFGLDLEVYTFNHEDPPAPTPLGSASGGGDPSPVTNLIKSLSPEDSVWHTRFVEIITTKVEELVKAPVPWNQVSYPHAPVGDSTPPGLPNAQVELMVIMSDGHDSSGATSFGPITTAKDNKFNVVSIAVGNDYNESGLKEISEEGYFFSAPEDGNLADAVSDAITAIKNYYDSFYVVDYMPTALLGSGDTTYSIKLVDNGSAGLDVTYDQALVADWPSVQPYCCKLRIAPGAPAGDPVTFAAGDSVEFTAVRLWTAVQPEFSWTFTSDGNMTIDGSETSEVTLNANHQSSATLTVGTVGAEGWSVGPLNIEAR
ncbi:MAG: VWA domain-containing protein [Gammaproteobacteria bacterium]|nr:VWA domain-containing protein [Gammaproteobacteria bacterium]